MITAGHKIVVDGRTFTVEHASQHPAGVMYRVNDGRPGPAQFVPASTFEAAGAVELPCADPGCVKHGVAAFNAMESRYYDSVGGWGGTVDEGP